MNLKFYLIVVIGLIAVHHAAACNCKNEGVDVCTNKECTNKGYKAIRPYPVHMPKIQKPLFKSICKEHHFESPKTLNPIGDVCNCGKQIIKPAPMPNVKPYVSIFSFLYKSFLINHHNLVPT